MGFAWQHRACVRTSLVSVWLCVALRVWCMWVFVRDWWLCGRVAVKLYIPKHYMSPYKLSLNYSCKIEYIFVFGILAACVFVCVFFSPGSPFPRVPPSLSLPYRICAPGSITMGSCSLVYVSTVYYVTDSSYIGNTSYNVNLFVFLILYTSLLAREKHVHENFKNLVRLIAWATMRYKYAALNTLNHTIFCTMS